MNIDYSIAIFGSVSCGKSTLINSIFAKHLSQMNIRRTTMTPQVYNFNCQIDTHIDDDTEILLQNEEINSKFQVEIWDGKTINSFDSPFPPNFLPENPNLNFRLYDLPGLNDQSTSHIYMNWARNNFSLFDCIILVIDINSGLNTSDEINICELIFSKMAVFQHVNLIILTNKCDEIDYRNGQYIVCNREKEEIFNEQVIPTLNRLKEKYKIDESITKKVIGAILSHDDWIGKDNVPQYDLILSTADKASFDSVRAYSYTWASNKYCRENNKPIMFSL